MSNGTLFLWGKAAGAKTSPFTSSYCRVQENVDKHKAAFMLYTALSFTTYNQIFHILLTYQFSRGFKMKVSHLDPFHWAEGESLSFYTLHDIAIQTTHTASNSCSYIRSRNMVIVTTGNTQTFKQIAPTDPSATFTETTQSSPFGTSVHYVRIKSLSFCLASASTSLWCWGFVN
jgi:hypothetical protein